MAEADRVIAKFQRRINGILKDYEELSLALNQKRREASLQALIAEQCVMSQAVFWESFIHELILSHLCDKPETYLSDLKKRVSQSVAGKFPAASRWVRVRFPGQLSRGRLLALVDPKGWNITASTAEELRIIANQMLPGAQAIKFSFDADDRSFIDLLVALRNYLGHRSSGSMRILRERIAALDGAGKNSHLCGAIIQVGTYLKTQPAPGVGRRVAVIAGRLVDISNSLK